MKKRTVILPVVVLICTFGTYLFFTNIASNENEAVSETTKQQEMEQETKDYKNNNKIKKVGKQSGDRTAALNDTKFTVKKANLYSDLPSNSIPLSGIYEVSNLNEDIQNRIKNIIDSSSEIFLIKKQNDKLVIVSENPDSFRHGIDFTEIFLQNGHQIRTTLGYSDKIKDSDNDKWEFDESEQKQPLSHIKYRADGTVEFSEIWNYDSENPVKYEMKDGNGKIVSIKKENLDNDNSLRVEHLVYDADGNTKINVSASYEGADIKRFTYYNADKQEDSASVFSEYSDGLKTKELVYTSDLKIQNTYISDYENGTRKNIIILDNENNEIDKIVSE